MGSREFLAWLEKEMDQRHWRQADLVRATGLAQSVVSRWWGQGSMPEPKSIEALARALLLPVPVIVQKMGQYDGPIVMNEARSEILDLVNRVDIGMDTDRFIALRALLRAWVEEDTRRAAARSDGRVTAQ